LGEDTEFEVRQRNTTTTIVDYQWSSFEFLTFTSADSSTAIFAPDMIGIDYLYSVTVTDSNGCTDVDDTGLIIVRAPMIPNGRANNYLLRRL